MSPLTATTIYLVLETMPFNIEKARQTHGDRYDYSKVKYVDYSTKIEIVCPEHGSFWQIPRKHIGEGRGCIKCRDANMRGVFDETKARAVHGDRYDYSKVAYVNADTKVEIFCPDHGAFWQTPYNHINSKKGCARCGGARSGDRTRLSTQKFIANARAVHGDKYDYSLVVYVNARTKVKILCPKHGEFMPTPTNHVHIRMGCPHCGSNMSMSGKTWIDSFNNPNMVREHIQLINGKRFKFDGYDPTTNTVYEYFGFFWHGHPEHTDHTKINPRTKTTFASLYAATLDKIRMIEDAGFTLVYAWGD